MASKYTKKCSTSLIIKEIQIKTTLRFHLTQLRTARIKDNNNKNAGEEAKQEALYTTGGNTNVQTLWKTVWRFLKKTELELPYEPVISLLGIYPKEHKTGYSRDTYTSTSIVTLLTIAKFWKQARCPTTDE
jgi:hypothetical protein